MICPNCNKEIENNVNFCRHCGAKQNITNNNYNYPANNYNIKDAGETDALISMVCGIMSIFLGPLFAIISLVFASKYKNIGNGQNNEKVLTGKICSWISIVSTILFFILALFVFGGFISFLKMLP